MAGSAPRSGWTPTSIGWAPARRWIWGTCSDERVTPGPRPPTILPAPVHPNAERPWMPRGISRTLRLSFTLLILCGLRWSALDAQSGPQPWTVSGGLATVWLTRPLGVIAGADVRLASGGTGYPSVSAGIAIRF